MAVAAVSTLLVPAGAPAAAGLATGRAGQDVSGAEADLAAAGANRRAAEARLADLTARAAALEAEIGRLDAATAQLTEDLAEARRALREYAVEAFIDGGQSRLIAATLDLDEAASLAWRSDLMGGQVGSAAESAERFAGLREDNDPERVRAATELDRVRSQVEDARFDMIQAAALERDAERELQSARAAAAEAEAAARAAAEATANAAAAAAARTTTTAAPRGAAQLGSPTRTAPPASGGGRSAPAPAPAPSGGGGVGPGAGSPTAEESATLARIRACESGGNYSIVSASGRYRGAYQFDYSTWAAMGGTGDPAAASPAEQDYRALLLLRQRGTRPWPHCGRS
jgi:hypothetical protein